MDGEYGGGEGGNRWNGVVGKGLVCGEDFRINSGAGGEIGIVVSTWNEIWTPERFVGEFAGGGAYAHCSSEWSTLVDFG